MKALPALQERFQRFLLEDDNDVVEDVTASGRIDPRSRLRIYHNAYRARLVEALSSDYTSLQRQLGEDAFEQAALAFITATPSVHRNLRWYGQSLPAFLRTTSPWNQTPWAGELAQFEWTITLAFDAPDQDCLDFAQVAALDPAAWPRVTFRFHPSLHDLELRSNAPTLRKAADEDLPAPAPAMQDTPLNWIVWRKSYSVLYRSLAPEEAWALREARRGENFTRLCEGLCEWVDPEGAAGLLAGMLRTWVDDGLIVALDF